MLISSSALCPTLDRFRHRLGGLRSASRAPSNSNTFSPIRLASRRAHRGHPRDICRPRTSSGRSRCNWQRTDTCGSRQRQCRGAEVTETLPISTAGHLLTLGLHGELLHFHDPLVQVSAGRWFFATLDALAKGVASHYDRGLPGPTPGADFTAVGVGFYAQDRWMPIPRLTVTAG